MITSTTFIFGFGVFVSSLVLTGVYLSGREFRRMAGRDAPENRQRAPEAVPAQSIG